MKKRHIGILALTFSVVSLVSCSGVDSSTETASENTAAIETAEKQYNKNETADTVTKKDCKFINKNEEYTIAESTVEAYYVNGSKIPYVDIEEMNTALTGYIRKDVLEYASTDTGLSIKNKNTESAIEINITENTVRYEDSDFTEFEEETGTTNFSANMKFSSAKQYQEESGYSYNFSDYYMNFYRYEEKTLIPFAVYNDIFGSPNYYCMYFNGTDFYGTDTGVDEDNVSLLDGSLQNETETSEERQFNYHHMAFLFENMYGLYDEKGVSSFDELAGTYKAKLLSTSSSVYYKAYRDFIYKFLDEGHSYITCYGYHGTASTRSLTEPTSINDLGNRAYSMNYDYFHISYDYSKIDSEGNYVERIMTGSSNASGLVYFYGNTAMFELSEFTTGTDDEIYNEDKSVKEDAYQYDSYRYFKKCFDLIDGKSGVSNVVINFSRNGGGNVGAMMRCLGFVFNGQIPYAYENESTGLRVKLIYDIDVNDDDIYGDETDYASKYNIYIVTSHYSYSSANTFSAYAKYYGNMKLIGNDTGGGACSILPTVMADGTTIYISSMTKIIVPDEDGNDYQSLENGIKADISLSSYADFLSTSAIDAAIKASK